MRQLLYLLLFLPFLSFSQESNFPELEGPYLGQKPPGKTPEIFAPQILTSNKPIYAFCSVFSPDGNEFYFCTGEKICDILCMKKINNKWTNPEIISFNSRYNDIDMRISTDGFKIFFQSWRPLPGSSIPDKTGVLWFSERIGGNWDNPKPLMCGNKILRAGYPDISQKGNLYFSMRDKITGNIDIHYSTISDGKYNSPVNLGSSVNTEYTEGDLCVSPDESFIIVSCWDRPDNTGCKESDLYISFRHNNTMKWTKLVNMGGIINTELIENCPTISPDGKYLFFQRFNGVDKSETYWVDAKIIEDLRPKNLKSRE